MADESRPGAGESACRDAPLNEEHDVEALRSAQSEVRTVLDHQVKTANDLDDKAMRTARLTGVLIGFILTAVTFLARDATPALSPFINPFSFAGGAALVLSIILAIATYTTSYTETGIGAEGVERLIDRRYAERQWLVLLLRSEAAWMRANNSRQQKTARLLTASHALIIVGIVLLVLGILVPVLSDPGLYA